MLDNLTWTHGNHTIKTGVDFNFSPGKQQRETNYGGQYTFKTLSDYLAALAGDNTKISRYQQSVAANGTQGQYKGTQREYAAFFTASIKLHRDLTVTAGLRWDGQVNPQPTTPNPDEPITRTIPNDLKMWQPRLGLAWNVGGKGTTVLRLSGGLFDSRTPSYLMQRVFTDNGLNTVVLDTNTDNSILKFLKVPNAIAQLPADVKTPINSLYAFDPDFRNPRSGQVALAIERQIDKHTKVTLGFVRNSTWNLQRRLDTNLFAPVTLSNGLPVYPAYDSKGVLVQASGFNATTGQAIFIDSATGKTFTPKVARPDATLGQINLNKSVAHSGYGGFSINVLRRMSRAYNLALTTRTRSTAMTIRTRATSIASQRSTPSI
ncbi:MAG: TonB-dependent receptor [Acidobacteria bacterium]|nr:TonB-dependent receptor [Acidobacteriota bacterium]MBI3427499.1 TonB-dependent receptor [Acidobacteriota bacterium]